MGSCIITTIHSIITGVSNSTTSIRGIITIISIYTIRVSITTNCSVMGFTTIISIMSGVNTNTTNIISNSGVNTNNTTINSKSRGNTINFNSVGVIFNNNCIIIMIIIKIIIKSDADTSLKSRNL